MERRMQNQISAEVGEIRLPRYREIPDVGLYLEQVTKYISDVLAPLTDSALTGSMISNYVKRGLLANPVKKQYSREQIAYLIFIAVGKNVLSMDEIRLMVGVQQRSYASDIAYNYFCDELENVLSYILGRKEALDVVGVDSSEEKVMLRTTIITIANKIYLDKLFAVLQKEEK